MAKATHIGTCQCCGSQQKLPSGVLSNHGYTEESFYLEHTALTNFMHKRAYPRIWEYQEIWDYICENEDKHAWWML